MNYLSSALETYRLMDGVDLTFKCHLLEKIYLIAKSIGNKKISKTNK